VVVTGIEFGQHCLAAMRDAGFEILKVYAPEPNTASDPADPAVLSALSNGRLRLVKSLNDADVVRELDGLRPDVIWVLGWSEVIKRPALNTARIGWIGSHPTELPKYRGRAPIAWSLRKGLSRSALTLFWLDEGVDSGDIAAQEVFPIDINDTARTLYSRVIGLGRAMVVELGGSIERGVVPRVPQDPNGCVEVWPRRTERDSEIDWSENDIGLHNQIRCVAGLYPPAYVEIDKRKLLITRSEFVDGRLRILQAQFEGGVATR
jgi:methionyl-tRNA formyltransferase